MVFLLLPHGFLVLRICESNVLEFDDHFVSSSKLVFSTLAPYHSVVLVQLPVFSVLSSFEHTKASCLICAVLALCFARRSCLVAPSLGPSLLRCSCFGIS